MARPVLEDPCWDASINQSFTGRVTLVRRAAGASYGDQPCDRDAAVRGCAIHISGLVALERHPAFRFERDQACGLRRP